MAYIKIFPIKVTDKKALDYITNPDKTDEKLLVSSFGCSPETADLEFAMTREQTKKNRMDKGDNLAFHLIQSFKPGEVDAETSHRLGQQFADEVLKGKYEYVISTHVDKNHIHNHIIFNATSFIDHHKYVSNKRSYHKICHISNRICQENGLATSMPTNEKGKSYKENMEYHRGTSWKAKLRVAVDKAIWSSINYDEFLQKMQLAGYETRQGKHLSFRAPEQKNFTYMKSLGNYYTEENVRARLEQNRYKTKTPKHLSREARLYINISTYVTTGNREGFERWAKLNNLKEAARTFNYLSENNLLNYENFQQHISDVENSVKAADQRLEEISTELGTQKLIQKHCDSYRLCRKVIEDCKSAKNSKAYRTRHQAEYQLHDSLKKELQDLGVTRIPSSEKIQKKIENLELEQAATIREKQELQKKQKTLEVIQQNFTVLLAVSNKTSALLSENLKLNNITRDE
jgi:relaxase/mobilisation nuclease domain